MYSEVCSGHRRQEVAELAAWLGNDETHYVRRWEDKDIEDLEILVDLTVNAITNALRTKKYLREMKERSGP